MTDREGVKGTIICCVLFFVLIGAYLIYDDLTFKYVVFFDNGYKNDFDIFIDGKNKGSVDPVSREEILMMRGEHTIEIRKKTGELVESNEVTLSEDKQYEHCKYIYNIGRKYFYYVELCEYSTEGGTKRGGWDTVDIGSETFMRYYADYDLDENCPKEIAIPYASTQWTKRKLKRRNNPSAIKIEKDGHSGSGAKTLEVGQTSTIVLDSPKIVERAYIKVGCKDGEKMDGYIEYWEGQKWKYLTSFSDAGCGDYVHFDQVTTRKLRLTMTGGGGDDEHISWHCCGSDGWKVYDEAGDEKDEEISPETQLENSLAGYWNFDEDTGGVATDLSGNGNDGTIHGAKLVDGKYDGNALSFDGKDDYVGNANLLSDANTFTMEIWIFPRTTHEIDDESTSGLTGVSGQKYVIYPTHGKAKWGAGHAGAGITVGTNGVSVYEHAHNYMPPLLVWQGSLSGWTHIVVVYNNKQPSLYVNGEFKKTGLISTQTYVHPSIGTLGDGFGGGSWGYFNGIIDEVRIYNYALTEDEIKTSMLSRAVSS